MSLQPGCLGTFAVGVAGGLQVLLGGADLLLEVLPAAYVLFVALEAGGFAAVVAASALHI